MVDGLPDLPRVDVAYALIHDPKTDRVLMVQNRDSWSLPGGAREPGETLGEAAVREVREETGLVVTLEGVVDVSERLSDVHDLFVTFWARVVGGTLGAHPDADVLQAAWVDRKTADDLMPWYQGGVSARLKGPTAAYSVVVAYRQREG